VTCETGNWTAVVLAAGRGPGDPLARAFSVTHKCLIPVAGKPMLAHVIDTLRTHDRIGRIVVSIDEISVARAAIGEADDVELITSASSASASAAAAVRQLEGNWPILLTTADHVLLDGAMLAVFLQASDRQAVDLTVGLARRETILAQYPDARRTYLRFGRDQVSGCNLYGALNAEALKAIDFWQFAEKNRKKPMALARAFGIRALMRYAAGLLTLDSAFALASRRLGLNAKPILMPDANAAIDLDKPEDKVLVEKILSAKK
jgi:GTP:adenosylcobinamide-phosphate guanylyltransferase